MIVRNEESKLPLCLESVQGLASEIIVVDTGSTDATPRIAARYGAQVLPFDFSFVDFAAARNYGIERAKGRWILILDADESLEPSGAPMIQKLMALDANAGYFLERHNYSSDSPMAARDYVVRLFPNRPDYRYRGRVHETIDAAILAGGGQLHKTALRIDHRFSSDRETRRRKNLRYVEILKEEIAADPTDDSRLDFLAAEYHQLEMFHEATEVAERIALARPLDPRAHLFAGVYHFRYKDDLVRARADFEEAVRLRPGYAEAISFLNQIAKREAAGRKVALVTGASRGIGAATALKLAAAGYDVAVNYRSKGARADEVSEEIAKLGRRSLPVQADLTIELEVLAMMDAIRTEFQRIDVLVLNASGGLEKDKGEDYAMALNRDAQLLTANAAAKLMPEGARIVFVTSHWAHFYGEKAVLADYELVAKTKRAGEQALREFTAPGVSLVVVSGDMIEGTITPRLLERKNRGLMEQRREEAKLPTVDEFAEAITAAALDPKLPNGHTVFIGSTEY